MSQIIDNGLEKYKMRIFNHIIKLLWEDKIEEIDKLPDKILGEDIKDENERAILKNFIRIVMGLDPINNLHEDESLKELAKKATLLNEISDPIITVITDACKNCSELSITEDGIERCNVRDKHMQCNENNNCSGCGDCMSNCNLGAISDKIEFVPIINMLKDKTVPVYAIVAPAYIGQFGKDATPGKIRAAFKSMGFTDMIEVALAADILSAKESYEYHHHMKTSEGKYFITSCCCPVWVSMIQKNYTQIVENVSPSVSPMIACGRAIKVIDSNAKVVFIGPCTAKKKEITLDDVKGAVDFVLTFKEVEEIFNALEIDVKSMEEDNRVEASFAGRTYARVGGVSKAIEISVKSIDNDIPFKAIAFNGTKECKEGLEKLISGEVDATFIEGMGCIGGCVGGPRRNISVEEGTKNVDEYSNETSMKTPFDNINVAQFLTSLGIKKIESLDSYNKKEETSDIFRRKFI